MRHPGQFKKLNLKTMQKNIFKKEDGAGIPGFSLIETIIAITVIGLVITAAASLTQSSLRIGSVTMNQLIANHLAEEGLEITRNIRDSNWISNVPFRKGFEQNGLYRVSMDGPPYRLELISSEQAAEKITLSPRQSGAQSADVFSRSLSISPGQDNAVRISSIVTYIDKGTAKKAVLDMELTNWKKGPL